MPYTKTLSNWLTRINQPEEWLKPDLRNIADQTLIDGRETVIQRIAQEIRAGGLIVVASDYDVDGISAGVILSDVIQRCGGRVQMITASRFGGEGYGLSPVLAAKILALKPRLLITADFGCSDAERIQLMTGHGIDSLIVDHHVVPSGDMSALAVINPHKPNCASTYKNMCSGGLAWSIAGGLIRHLDLTKEIQTGEYLDMVCLSTIADVMVLDGDNRALVRAGLKTLSEAKRPGIRALMEIAKITPGEVLDARSVSFRLAPAINAPGRLQSPQVIVRLLLEKDMEQAREIAKEVKEIWDRRRIITDEITAEAIEEIESNGWDKAPSICVGRESWGHGVVGISAARLVDKYKVPVACIGSEGRGSLRGPAGSRLYDALAFSSDTLKRWGGHQAAAGCHVDFSQLAAFRSKFREFHEQALSSPDSSHLVNVDTLDLYLDLDLSDPLEQVEKDLYLLEPTGQGNPKPILRTTGIVTDGKEVKGGHGKFNVKLGNKRTLPCFIISRGAEIDSWKGKSVTITGDLRKNEWKGKVTVEMFVESVTLM
jgi:single-stranded-DNA-specific exonuclease